MYLLLICKIWIHDVIHCSCTMWSWLSFAREHGFWKLRWGSWKVTSGQLVIARSMMMINVPRETFYFAIVCRYSSNFITVMLFIRHFNSNLWCNNASVLHSCVKCCNMPYHTRAICSLCSIRMMLWSKVQETIAEAFILFTQKSL